MWDVSSVTNMTSREAKASSIKRRGARVPSLPRTLALAERVDEIKLFDPGSHDSVQNMTKATGSHRYQGRAANLV